MSALACKKKDKDDPSSDQNPGGSGGSGNTSIGVIEFRVRGELLRFSVREAYYMYGRAQAFSHKLNRPSDTLGCTISFAYPTSRSDTSYSANITARSEIFVFIYTLYRSQGDSTYSSQTVFKSPRFSMNVSVSNNQAQGTFSGWVYDSVDPNDSLQITDGQFQIQF
ncbi:MAG: hypothetical protein NZ933_03415 [Bacteroidia bacterium]|nr:hypothetical protein [Bacteroidia bacterium]